MNELIKDRSVGKFYRTVVTGKLDEDIYLKGYLHKDECSNKVTILSDDPHNPDYSYIETNIKVLEYIKNSNVTLLEVELITGKPHQIRAHLSSINHPIVGDIKYGGKPYKGLNYQLLHSYRLEFPDDLGAPFDSIAGKEFIAELPDTFNLFQCPKR